ncbi:MAG: aspartate--tRNA ligase [Chloroherpetonaceae bacterium]|nr:aspartate--tRNA ligase [Chloroherpetonaceae bacterium]MDW8437596.1 aspartate--tRNA ligase [Chloroherpetonaceae bacterium]
METQERALFRAIAPSAQYRTHFCGELRKSNVSETVKLAGWVHRKRDHGGLIFIDLRDHTGIAQIVFEPHLSDIFRQVEHLRVESVICVEGAVIARAEDAINPNLPTGEVEVVVKSLSVESAAEPMPFPIADDVPTSEELRLKYRFLDLRREKLHRNILYRSKIISEIRRYLWELGFNEIQTPILTSSSPEGARDYLVPSRLHPGKFYALPQAPQQFKQLLMVAGFDKYFQIAPCFRDEDARADRSPGEFYQLDMEMSFITQDDLFKVLEGLFEHITTTLSQKRIMQLPFPRIKYLDAMNRYGSDKPDLRNPLVIDDVTAIFKNSSFKVFASNAEAGRCVKALKLKGRANEPRLFFDKAEEFAKKELGLPGLAYIRYKENGEVQSPIYKFLSDAEKEALINALRIETGDVVFFAAGAWEKTCKAMGAMRNYFAPLFELDKDLLAFCWIVDFPMFEYNEEEKKIDFSHNPFSMPQGGLEALLTKNPLEILAYQYDIVCNGIELSSGAIRNHKPEIMYKAFEIAGYSKEEVDKKFGHMIRAFQHGAPPHGGIAPGIDRIVMLYADESNIREVIAFPMNQKAQDLMTGAPSEVTPKQLRELHIKLDLPEKHK